MISPTNIQDSDTSMKENYLDLIFLELLSFAPLFILLGNVIPPFPIKLHYIGLGLIFLVSFLRLLLSVKNKWYAYVILAYLIAQGVQQYLDIKSMVDFFFGPLVLLNMLDLIYRKQFSASTLRKYTKRFVSLVWIPVGISSLQYFGIMPFTFWNATFINSTLDAFGNDIYRPNGFLYHGSELSILICFLGLFQFFKKEKKAFWTLLFLILAAYATYFKAIAGCMVLLFVYYLGFINKGGLSKYRIISKPFLIFFGSIISVGLISLVAYYLHLVKVQTGYYFPPQMLTGRGSIWNIYSDAINDYSLFDTIFGAGLGSSSSLFTEYATPRNFYPLVNNPDSTIAYLPHNAFLNIFIDAGLLGLSVLTLLFYLIKNQTNKWWPNKKWNNRVLIGIVFVPLITIGITIGVFDMAIYWCCLCMLLLRWHIFSEQMTDLKSLQE